MLCNEEDSNCEIMLKMYTLYKDCFGQKATVENVLSDCSWHGLSLY